jgi:lipopolysaccharide export system permease protein
MNRIDRYLARTALLYTGLVLAVLLSLGSLLVFLGQQTDIGIGTYTLSDALWFTLLQLPNQAFELMPMAALIGTLLGLGLLQRDGELVALRAAGVSIWRIALAAGGAGCLLLLVMGLLGEVVSPPLDRYARQSKMFAKFADVELGTAAGTGGAWVRDGNRVVSFGQQSADGTFGGLTWFEFDEQHHLRSMAEASTATQLASGRWRLLGWRETSLHATGVRVSGPGEHEVNTQLSAEFLGLAVINPRSLSMSGLWRYISYQRANGLDATVFAIALWSRLARTLSVVLVCMLAVPFVFGPVRSGGAGRQTVIGILLGVGFFLLTRTLENSGQVYGLDPVFIGWAPVVLLAGLTTVLIRRTR